MDYFERFLGLVESAEADLPPIEYQQLLNDIRRVAGDKCARNRDEMLRALREARAAGGESFWRIQER